MVLPMAKGLCRCAIYWDVEIILGDSDGSKIITNVPIKGRQESLSQRDWKRERNKFPPRPSFEKKCSPADILTDNTLSDPFQNFCPLGA